MSSLSSELEAVAREGAALWKAVFTSKTKEEWDALTAQDEAFGQKLRQLDDAAKNQVNGRAEELLGQDAEVPYFVRDILIGIPRQRALIRERAAKEEGEVVREAKRRLARQLIGLIGPQLKEQIPSVIEDALGEQIPKEKLEEAVKEAEKGKPVRAKRGCMHIEIGDVVVGWS